MQAICYILLYQSLNLQSGEGRDGTDEGITDCLTKPVGSSPSIACQTQSVNHHHNQFQSSTLILRERSNKKWCLNFPKGNINSFFSSSQFIFSGFV